MVGGQVSAKNDHRAREAGQYRHFLATPARLTAAVAGLFITGFGLARFFHFLGPAPRTHAGPVILADFSAALTSSIQRTLPEPHAGFLIGLITGGAGQLPADFRAAVLATGTMHLLALSGWNVSIVIDAFEGTLRAVGLRKKFRLGIVVSGILLFLCAVGFSPSVVRAALMAAATKGAEFLGRPKSSGRALLLIAALMLAVKPALISDLSFLLSFAATFGIVFVTPIVLPFVGWMPEHFALRKNLASTIGATVATTPLIYETFGRASFVSIPANLMLLPFIPTAMGLGFFGALVGIVSTSVGRAIGIVSGFLLGYCIAVIRLFARIPGASANLQFPTAAAAVMSLGIVAAVVFHRYVQATKKMA